MAKALSPLDIHHCSIETAIIQQEGSPIHIFEKKIVPDLKCFPYEIQSPVKSFKGRRTQIEELKIKLTKKKIVVVFGRGGIGKSELVKKYAFENKFIYQKNMFWINAESDEEISKIFKALFKTFYKYDQSLDHLDLMCIIKNVYRFFESSTLIVFDNAADQQSIFQNLPNEENKNIYTIITTQYEIWNDIVVLNLNGVTADEAVSIFKEIMKTKYNDERDKSQWKNLAKQLEYLPLAIQIAAAYIYEESDEFNSVFTIDDYIMKFNESENILFERTTQDNSKSFITTFELTLKKISIQEQRNCGSHQNSVSVINILNLCAHLDPYYISQSVLMKFFENSEISNLNQLIRDKLNIIKKYSLISIYNTKINIHGKIQQILRYRQEKRKENKTYFFSLLKLLINDENMFYHYRYAMKYAEKHVDIAVKFYKENKSSEYLKILTRYGCHKTLSKIFDYMCPCICFRQTLEYKIKKYVLLYEAVLSRNVETVELILYYSKTVNIQNIHGWTPIRAAVESNCIEIQKLLIESGALEERNKDGITQLHECLKFGTESHIKLAHILTDCDVVVHLSDNDGNTPLHYAAKEIILFEKNKDYRRIVKKLVDKFRDDKIDTVNKSKCTPLHIAAECNHLQLVNWLIDKGANYLLQNKKGNSALMEATIKNNKQIVMYLCQVDVQYESIIMKNKEGCITLHYTIKPGNVEIAMYLAEYLNDIILIKDKSGNTALHLAIIYKQNIILTKLLNATNDNIEAIKNYDGYTPLKLAQKLKNKEAISLLKEHIQIHN